MSSWKFNASLPGRPAFEQDPPSSAPREHVVTVPSNLSSDFSQRSAPSLLPQTQRAKDSSSLTPFQRPSPFTARRPARSVLPVPSFVNASETSEIPASELPLRPLSANASENALSAPLRNERTSTSMRLRDESESSADVVVTPLRLPVRSGLRSGNFARVPRSQLSSSGAQSDVNGSSDQTVQDLNLRIDELMRENASLGGGESSRPRNTTNAPREESSAVVRSRAREQERATGSGSRVVNRATLGETLRLARRLTSEGEHENAEAQYRVLVATEPNNERYISELVNCLYKQKLFHEAERYMRRLLPTDEKEALRSHLAYTMGCILYHLGKYVEAQSYLEAGIQQATPEELIARTIRFVDCLAKRPDPLYPRYADRKCGGYPAIGQEGRTALLKALKANPGSVAIASRLDRALGSSSMMFDKDHVWLRNNWLRIKLWALETIIRASDKRSGEFRDANLKYGYLLMQAPNTWKDAKPYLTAALEAADRLPDMEIKQECNFLLAELLHRGGEFESAALYYKKGIEVKASLTWRGEHLLRLCEQGRIEENTSDKTRTFFTGINRGITGDGGGSSGGGQYSRSLSGTKWPGYFTLVYPPPKRHPFGSSRPTSRWDR